MMRLDLATAEYIGARPQQQDMAAAMPLNGGAVLVLADGLGGHESGAEAARIVVEAFREASANGHFDNAAARRQALRETVDRANTRIAEGFDPSHGNRSMASTVVAAVVAADELSWVSVGDSHLYVWRSGRLLKLNEDHSQAGLMVRSGQYKASDPEVLAVRSVLVSALTGRKLEIVDLPQRAFKLEPGDVVMLASDGLNTLDDEEVEGIVAEARNEGAVKLSTALLERVRSRRLERQDNATVAIARVLEPERPAKQPSREPARKPPEQPGRQVPVEPVAAAASEVDSEARTERVPTPAPVAASGAMEEATVPVARAAAIAAAQPGTPPSAPPPEEAAAEPSAETESAAPPQDETARPEAAQPEPAKAGGGKPSPPRAAAASPRRATDGMVAPAGFMNRPAPRGAGVSSGPGGAHSVSAPEESREMPAMTVQAPSAAASLKMRAPAPSLSPRSTTPVGPSKRPSRGLNILKAILVLLLLWLIAGGVAIGAIAIMKPEWLGGILPGFALQETEPQPAAGPSQVQPAVVPAPPVAGPKAPAKLEGIDPAKAPAESRIGEEAAAPQRDTGEAATNSSNDGDATARPDSGSLQEPAAQSSDLVPPAPRPVELAAPPAAPPPVAAAPLSPAKASDPPQLVEEPRPASPPARQQKQRRSQQNNSN